MPYFWETQKQDPSFDNHPGDGSVVTWGTADYGGDCSRVQDQLRDVQQIQASSRAFAAILGDGSVVAWGHAGDSTQLQESFG